MKSIVVVIFLSLVFGNTDPLKPQPRRNKFGIGILAGGTRLKGDFAQTTASFAGGVALRFSPLSFFAISTAATYGAPKSGLDAVKTELLTTSLSATFFLFPRSSYRPFVSVGVSNFYYRAKDGDGTQLTAPDGRPIQGWQQGLQLGGGFELFTGRNWALTTYGDYVFSSVDDLDNIVQGANDGYFRVMFGFLRYFNKSDSRGDKKAFSLQHKEGVSFAQIRDNFPSKAGDPTDRQRRDLFSKEIYFQPGTSIVHEASWEHLSEIYRYLNDNPNEALELLGSNQDRIQDAELRELVYERAAAVKRHLVYLGLPSDRVIVGDNSNN